MTLLLVTVGVLLVAANGVFVATEFALVAARRSRLLQLARHDARARVVLAASRDTPGTLAATQLGITMASIGLGFVAESAVESSLVPLVDQVLRLPDPVVHAAGAALALGVVVAAHVLLGEMVPKNLAVTAPERIALWLVPLVRPFVLVARPAVAVLAGGANGLLRAVGIEPRSELSAAFDVQDIADMLEIAGRDGTIARADHELMGRAIRFAGRTAAQVMVPWRHVTTVPEGASPAEIERVAATSGHARLAVLRGEQVVGFAHVLDLLQLATAPPLHPVVRVPHSWPLVEVFEQMRRRSEALAVVTGSDDLPLGILTLEDLLEELLG